MNKTGYYNRMVRYYYRSRRKLAKLILAGKNLRKQFILKKRILKLKEFLTREQIAIKKLSAIPLVAGSCFLFQPSVAQGQISFNKISANPFAFSNV